MTHRTENGVRAGFNQDIWRGEYEVIVGEHTPTPNLDEMSYDELVSLVEGALKALRTRSYKSGYDQGRFDAEIEAAHGTYEKSNQQKRDEIVAQAKRDVSALIRRNFTSRTDFIVNTEKRTVVALRKSYRLGYVNERGIAKCAPNDCFNAHIGKAIALRRALGLEVHAEYLNVPQPTEVREGDYVARNGGTERMVVSSEDKFPPYDKSFIGLDFVNRHSDMFKIIDDTRAGESE
ncbi:hypothetical protein [Bacillus pumilus]|uniref:hypothetical protein n=1 Tax=Bacillus pumilus TaxID=1408 RepID=UPI002E228BA3|nr:hypothetical protein [Bacillus pumilus]